MVIFYYTIAIIQKATQKKRATTFGAPGIDKKNKDQQVVFIKKNQAI